MGETLTIKGKPYVPEIYTKYLANMRSGVRAAAKGEIREFKGYRPELYNGTVLRAFLDEKDKSKVIERVINPIVRLANGMGINIYPAESTMKPHFSIAGLIYNPEASPNKEDFFKNVEKDEVVQDAVQILKGQKLTLDTLWGGDTVTLAACHIPESILGVRRDFSQLGLNYNAKELTVSNLLHMAIARMGDNANINSETMKNFEIGILRVHHSIIADPIDVTIFDAELMTVTKFKEIHEKGLPQSIPVSN